MAKWPFWAGMSLGQTQSFDPGRPMSASLIGGLGSSAFRPSTLHYGSVDIAHGLALLFGIGTKALPAWGSRRKWNNLWDGLAGRLTPVGPSSPDRRCEHTAPAAQAVQSIDVGFRASGCFPWPRSECVSGHFPPQTGSTPLNFSRPHSLTAAKPSGRPSCCNC